MAGTTAGRTATVQADTSDLGAQDKIRTILDGTSVDAVFDGPAAANRMTDRPKPNTTRRTTPTSLPAPGHKPLLSADVDGPVTVHVTTDGVISTVNTTVSSTAKTVNNTVRWAKTTIDRTVQSLPVKATVTNSKDSTDVNVQALGTSASAHIQH
jgi:hypothetical protein